jgi:hypothetical protein
LRNSEKSDDALHLRETSTISTPSDPLPVAEITSEQVMAHIKSMNTPGIKYVPGHKPNFTIQISVSIAFFTAVFYRLLDAPAMNVQELIQMLSAGATILALSAAWLAISFQNKQKLDDIQKNCRCNITLLDAELLRFFFACCSYSSKKKPEEYVSDWSYFNDWCVPGAYSIPSIHFSVIRKIVDSGVQSGFSEELLKALTLLQVQIERFNKQSNAISNLLHSNFDLAGRLRKRLEKVDLADTEWKRSFSSIEVEFINLHFQLQANLHLQCIGDRDNGPNLYTSYSDVLRELSVEKKCHEDFRPARPPGYSMAESAAISVFAIGASIVLWSIWQILMR